MERKWWTLLAVCVATFMLLLDITVVNVALPDIEKELHTSFTDLQWVVDAYALTLAATMLNAGSLGDLLGRKRVFLVAIALFTIASTLCGAAQSPEWLIIARGAQGIGGAGMFAVSLAIISQEFHGRERGTAFMSSQLAFEGIFLFSLKVESCRGAAAIRQPVSYFSYAEAFSRPAGSCRPLKQRASGASVTYPRRASSGALGASVRKFHPWCSPHPISPFGLWQCSKNHLTAASASSANRLLVATSGDAEASPVRYAWARRIPEASETRPAPDRWLTASPVWQD